jgi:hypothetical protein
MARIQRPLIPVALIASLALTLPTSTLDSPGSCGSDSTSFTRGRRMSASMMSTRCPACANAIARFVATSVLPSPGPVCS